MKKTVAAALAAAFVMGASATPTFAAANPFSDVPAGHWAYGAVATLAQEGIIEGYGDGTYRGDRLITRYEMAQMIAKALAKTDNPYFGEYMKSVNEGAGGPESVRRSPHAVKADLDRLKAEFADELEALGVRVSELEKHADVVKWTGELRYRYWNDREKVKHDGKIKRTSNQLQLRLFPTATVNDHWKIKARMTASTDMSKDTTGTFKVTYAFAEGVYDKFTFRVGKMPFYTNVDEGLVMDDFFSGFQAVYGDKFKVALMAGRWNTGNDTVLYNKDGEPYTDEPASYQGGEISYDDDKLYVGAGFHHFRSDVFQTLPGYKPGKKNASVWTVGARYQFDNGFKIGGAYASNTKAQEYKRSWTAGIGYKGANRNQPGSWGLTVDYRYVANNVSLAPTYDTFALRSNKKGVEVGATWAPMKNTQAYLNYFWGKTLDTDQRDNTFFGRFSWFF